MLKIFALLGKKLITQNYNKIQEFLQATCRRAKIIFAKIVINPIINKNLLYCRALNSSSFNVTVPPPSTPSPHNLPSVRERLVLKLPILPLEIHLTLNSTKCLL